MSTRATSFPEKGAGCALPGQLQRRNCREFLVSRDVSKVNGEGTCEPRKGSCEFLTLKEGETAYLRYADGNRYALRVTDIFFVRIPESEYDQSD